MKWRSGTLDDLYFEWLYEQVADLDTTDPRHTHWQLMRRLYCTEFKPYVANDDNRAQDGLELRDLFSFEEGEFFDPHWDTLPCSIFEMLIALARRMEFEGGRSVEHWFWVFMNNMTNTNSGWSDQVWNMNPRYANLRIDTMTNTLNERLYSENGEGGGLFPLKDPPEDQRGVELWYQMAAYLREEV